jgi:hypothetical protein
MYEREGGGEGGRVRQKRGGKREKELLHHNGMLSVLNI